jgi:hypothetical protein
VDEGAGDSGFGGDLGRRTIAPTALMEGWRLASRRRAQIILIELL